jgi:heme/copper-type cytochrome/quinol oxidase subunit 2
LIKATYWQSQLFKVLLPFIILVVFAVFSIVLKLYRQKLNPEEYRIKRGSSPTEISISLYSYGMVRLATYVLLTGMSPFRCFKQMDGSYTLVASPNLDCYDQQWNSNTFTIFLGILQVVLLPLVLMWVLWNYSSNDNKFMWRFGHLTRKYKDQFYYWEVVMMLKKLIFVMVVDLTNDYNSNLRAFLAESVLVTGVFVDFMVRPRKQTNKVNFL